MCDGGTEVGTFNKESLAFSGYRVGWSVGMLDAS